MPRTRCLHLGKEFASIVWWWLILWGCVEPLPAEERSVDRQLREFFDEVWEQTLADQPTWASHLGDLRYNDRWPDVSLQAYERRQQRRLAWLQRLLLIPYDQLSPPEQINYRLFRRQLEQELEGYQYKTFLMPIDHRGGLQDESSLADSLPFDSVKHYEDWIARLWRFPDYAAQTQELMREGIRLNIVQPRLVMQRVVAQLRRQIVDDPQHSLFYKPFLNFSAAIPPDHQLRLREEAQRALRQAVIPAYRSFTQFFETEYLPACFAQVGAWQLPRGEEFYAYAAREHTTTSLTPAEIHEIGLKEVARLTAEMEQIKRQVGFAGTLQQFFVHLREDPQFKIYEPRQLLQAYQAFCKRIDPQLPKLFKTLPRIPYGVEPIPEHMAPDTTTAYYRPPAADGSRAGTYFVNLYKPESRPTYEIPALSLHEAVPGHHLQIALALEQGDQPMFRRVMGFTAYVEGWALYAESLGDQLGAYQNPYDKFGQLTYEIWRAIRLVVDTGIHAYRWERQQAIDYFLQHAAKTELDVTNEVDRYIAWPGQALAYKIGELKIKELRARAQQRLGERFDIREFHDVILRPGAVPLDLLEELVEQWLQERAAGTP
ncbi:MAG: hypothetical protein KatS3mg114_1090 [Planctomycetaceae bacterium]|nr:MAG: hypothetical protein KatS3mg114_1090 [Planctomycetaceae bacterium]